MLSFVLICIERLIFEAGASLIFSCLLLAELKLARKLELKIWNQSAMSINQKGKR